MNRTMKALLVIAIVLSAVQVCALAIELLELEETSLSAFAAKAQVRWTVYWGGGLVGVVVGFRLRRRYQLAGDALCIAGTYLMLLGNNGGLFSHGHEAYRITTSVATLAFLLVLAVRGEVSGEADVAA